MVCRAMFDLQEGQGRTSETAWQDAAVGHPVVEMGRYHEASQDRTWSRFDLGHRKSIEQECSFYSDSGEHIGREIGRHLYQGDCGTAWGASIGDLGQGCAFYFQILEEIS